MKTSWRCLEDIFARRFEDVSKTPWKRLSKTFWRCLEDVLKTSWRCLKDVLARFLFKMSWRHLEDVFKKSGRRMTKTNILVLIKTSSEDVWVRRIYSSWRCLEDVFWRQRQKTSSRRLHQDDCLLGINCFHLKFKNIRSKNFLQITIKVSVAEFIFSKISCIQHILLNTVRLMRKSFFQENLISDVKTTSRL